MQPNSKKGTLSLKKETIAVLSLPKGKQRKEMPTDVPTGTGPTSGWPTCNHRQKLQQG
jgi:hypothetical protein